jgi:hypothetical protein
MLQLMLVGESAARFAREWGVGVVDAADSTRKKRTKRSRRMSFVARHLTTDVMWKRIL